MGLFTELKRLGRRAHGTDDASLLELVRRDPPAGWRLFLDRYSGRLLAWIRDFGFDHDESMDRYVSVCEKLAEHDCRRLREVRRLGSRGELVPWLRQVVRSMLINWAWSEQGRPRLLKAIEALAPLERQVFRLYYWAGLPASEVHGRLRSEGLEVELIEVYSALEAVQGALTAAKRWQLLSRLSRHQPLRSLASDSSEPAFEPSSRIRDPEHILLAAQAREHLREALENLSVRERLIVRLRYDDKLETREIADLLGENPAAVRRQLRHALGRLRQDAALQPRSSTA